MRFRATAIALAIVAAVGYGIHERNELERQQQATAPPRDSLPPAPFAVDRLGDSPGEDVTRYVALATPTAAFDAWSIINACEKNGVDYHLASKFDLPRRDPTTTLTVAEAVA